METKDIIQAIKDDNSQMLVKALYKEAFPPIVRYFKQKRGTKADAEDCFQEAMLTLIKKVKTNTFDEKYEVKNFLFVITRNIWYNKLKRAHKVNAMELEDFQLEDDTQGIESVLIDEERSHAITSLMNKAGERCKELLHLLLFENKKMKEVATIMGFSSDEVVKTNHYRCKQKLKNALKKDRHLLAILKA